MKNPLLVLVGILLISCKPASPVAPNSNGDTQVEHDSSGIPFNPALIQDDQLAPDQIGELGVTNDDLFKNGFVVFKETTANQSGQAIQLELEAATAGYDLYTRMHEHYVVTGSGVSDPNTDHWKNSHLRLTLTEVRVGRSDGTVEHHGIGSSKIFVSLGGKEKITLSWVTRLPSDTIVCPYFHDFRVTGLMNYSETYHIDIVGSSIVGSLSRSITALKDNGDGTHASFPIVNQQNTVLDQVGDDGVPKPDDMDFGCNGMIEVMN